MSKYVFRFHVANKLLMCNHIANFRFNKLNLVEKKVILSTSKYFILVVKNKAANVLANQLSTFIASKK